MASGNRELPVVAGAGGEVLLEEADKLPNKDGGDEVRPLPLEEADDKPPELPNKDGDGEVQVPVDDKAGEATPIKIGLIGGEGGSPKEIGRMPQRLDNIQIWTSANGAGTKGVINGIRFKYTDKNGKAHNIPENGAWGTTMGNYHVVSIDPGDYVYKIEGSFGKGPDGNQVITSLTFTTYDPDKTWGPYGDKANGKPFTVPLANAGIYAFFARAGTYLNAIGVYAQAAP